MNLTMIDGYTIYDLFISGAKNLIQRESTLNQINVFPVADNDTGTNLAITMKNIVTASEKSKNVHDTLNSISTLAISNAYGNSGMIFAQYLYGFSVESQGKESLTLDEFAVIAEKASHHAYEAVAEPKEGTILSIMRYWGEHLRNNTTAATMESFFSSSYAQMESLVSQTKYQLKVLLDNDVVDAGAKGFYYFIEGILQYFNKAYASLPTDDVIVPTLNSHGHSPAEVEKNRYCCQFLLQSDQTQGELRTQLQELGDSLVIAGIPPKLHIHIHSDHPHLIMKALEQTDVISQKIEDMKLLHSISYQRKHTIGILTDSIADLPSSFTDSEQIMVIPATLLCDSKVYLDKLTMTSSMIYEKIRNCKQHPTSSQPNASQLETTIHSLLTHFDHLICIFVSQQMSGTCQMTKQLIARSETLKDRVFCIDSGLNSSAEGILVMEAAKLVSEGRSISETVTTLEELKHHISIFVAINDFDSMIRGGRISKGKGTILKLLHLKPVISIDAQGKGVVYKKTFSQRSATRQILKTMKKDMQNNGILYYAVVCSEYDQATKAFCNSLEKLTGRSPAFIEPISPIVALNAGTGAYAVSYLKN